MKRRFRSLLYNRRTDLSWEVRSSGQMIDINVKTAFSHKIIEYVFVEAEKEVIK